MSTLVTALQCTLEKPFSIVMFICAYRKSLLVIILCTYYVWLRCRVCYLYGPRKWVKWHASFLFWLMEQLSNPSFNTLLRFFHILCMHSHNTHTHLSVLSGHHYNLLPLLCGNNNSKDWFARHQLLATGQWMTHLYDRPKIVCTYLTNVNNWAVSLYMYSTQV